MTSGRFLLNGDSNEGTNANNRRHSSTDSTTTTSSNLTATTISNATNGIKEHIRKFVFTDINSQQINCEKNGENTEGNLTEKLEIKIPELLHRGCGYSFHTWPSAPVLAWFLWERRQDLPGKRILELGSGCSLPGILAAKCKANVTLSDSCILPKSIAHIRKACLANDLVPGRDIEIIGLSWGLLLNSVFNLPSFDFIIAADIFYDPSVFEDIIVTVCFFLERNTAAKFLFTYQERSADWSIEALLKKWKLCARQVNIDDIGKSASSTGIDLFELMGGHTIHLIEITKER